MEGKNSKGDMIQLLVTHRISNTQHKSSLTPSLYQNQFKACPDLRPISLTIQTPQLPSGEKRYLCPVSRKYNCLVSFTTPGHARRHIRTHTGEKPYICPVCEHCFARRDNMNQHCQTHDKDERDARIHTRRSKGHGSQQRVSTLGLPHQARNSRHSTTQHAAEYSRV
jgi:uncharacterized Zn-finger protein